MQNRKNIERKEYIIREEEVIFLKVLYKCEGSKNSHDGHHNSSSIISLDCT